MTAKEARILKLLNENKDSVLLPYKGKLGKQQWRLVDADHKPIENALHSVIKKLKDKGRIVIVKDEEAGTIHAALPVLSVQEKLNQSLNEIRKQMKV